MVNLGLNWSSLLGIILAVAGAGLYFLRSWKPKLARDHDIFFAAVGLLCGGILLFQGWRLDPILAFGQFLLTGTAIFFAVESVNLRGVATQQAKSRPPIVEDDRPVSPVYSYVDAELEELEPVEEYPVNRRLRGDREYRNSRPDSYEDDYRQKPRTSRPAKPPTSDTTRRRRPRSEGRPSQGTMEDWDMTEGSDEGVARSRGRSGTNWDTPPTETTKPPRTRPRTEWDVNSDYEDDVPRRSRPSASGVDDATVRGTRPKRRRPSENPSASPSVIEPPADDYVDYRPVDDPDELDKGGRFDEE